MRRLLALGRREDGIAMLTVVFLAAFMTLLGVTFTEVIRSETVRSSHAVFSEGSYQAAEAGVNDYISKLLDDNLYYVHYVHPGEATRRSTGGNSVTAGNAWSYGLTWTYPSGKNAWRQLSNGYEYDLQVAPPSATSAGTLILATGRKVGSTVDVRTVEAVVRPSSTSDFQMLANADISYGSAASTYGKIYAGIDAGGTKHNVNHGGTAYADIFAEGSVTGSPTLLNGAKTYNSSTIRVVIKNPINFSTFLSSLTDIQRAAQSGGVYLDNSAKDAWKLTFVNNGTFTAASCTKVSGADVALTSPTCGSTTTYNVPSNGAVYVGQTAIISGAVQGRVTVASNDDIVISNNISYVTSGTDVLGLVAKNDVIVAQWTPTTLTWRAATIAETGAWHSYSNDGSHGTMTFNGSSATNTGGSMSMFTTRIYQYDTTLAYLPPPWFPTFSDVYTILSFRERPSATALP